MCINVTSIHKRLHEIAGAQKTDAVIQGVRDYCLDGWPKYQPHNLLLQPYWEKRTLYNPQ